MPIQKTLLIVDDDPNLVRSLRIHLGHEGYNILTGGDGNIALSLARIHRPDAILMDVNMPTVNGLRALKFLRTDKKTAEIPVILMSEIVSTIMEPLVQNVSRAAYLKKPLDVMELISFLKQFLNN